MRRLVCRIWPAFGFLFFAAVAAPAQVAPTVRDAIFRSRWEGLQADREVPRTATGLAGLRPGEEGYSAAEAVAEELLGGLRLGPVELNPGLSLGWEYSDRNNSGTTTNPTDDNSFFVAPSLGLGYVREIGPWSVSASYAGGFRYYFNPNYTAAGSGNDRNPFNQSGAFSLQHLGARHVATLRASGSSSTGLDVVSGENIAQTTVSAAVDWVYSLTSYTEVGADAAYSVDFNRNAGGGSTLDDSELGDFVGGVWVEWLATGKLNLRLDLDAGSDSQNIQGQGEAARNYVQALVSANYIPTEKLSFGAGLGAAYLTDPGVPEARETGLRPRYELSATYVPTEKTSFSGRIFLLGSDIRPGYRLAWNWQPRVNTGLSVALYQDQGFSLTVLDQVQVSRGIVGSLSQRLFSKVDLAISGGWEETENLSLSGEGPAARDVGQTYSYAFAAASLTWTLNSYSNWQAAWWSSTAGSGTGNPREPETRFTISFNLTF